MASTFQKTQKMLTKSLDKINDTFREMNAMTYGDTAESAE